MLHTIQIFITYVTDHWAAISALVGGGAGLSVFLQYILHKMHIDSKKLAYSLIHLLSIAGGMSAFYLDNVSVMPAYAGLVISAQTVHRFIVSPYYNRYILPYLTFLSENAAKQAVPATAPSQAQPLAEPVQSPAFVN